MLKTGYRTDLRQDLDPITLGVESRKPQINNGHSLLSEAYVFSFPRSSATRSSLGLFRTFLIWEQVNR